MSRYVDEMTREQLVEEVRDLLIGHAFTHDEIGDPTVVPLPRLRAGLKRIRLRMLLEGREHHPPGDSCA